MARLRGGGRFKINPREWLAFREHLEFDLRLSPHTAELYASSVRRFAAWLKDTGTRHKLRTATANNIRDYRRERLLKFAPTTVINNLSALRAYYGYLVAQKKIARDPTLGIANPRRIAPSRPIISLEEVERAIKCVSVVGPGRPEWADDRDRAILAVLLYTGMRRGSIYGLNLEDVDLPQRTILIRHVKGGKKSLRVPICGRLGTYLTDWMGARPATSDPALFLNREGKRFAYQLYHRIIVRAQHQACAGRAYSAHAFRRLFATLLHERGADLLDIQKLMGHASISSTEIYIRESTARLRSTVELLDKEPTT